MSTEHKQTGRVTGTMGPLFTRRLRPVCVVGVTSLLLAACGGGGGETDAGDGGNPEVALRVAHAQEPDHPYQVCGLEHMQQTLSDNPDANLSIEIFGGAQLGSNEETLESVQAGNLDMTVPGIGSLTVFEPKIGALETAFAFEDFDHLQEVVDGEIGQELLTPLQEQANIRVLGPLWKLGSRHVTSNQPVTSPEDLQGKTLRTQDTPASRATAEALGASATPVDFSELYLALSQGVVDGQENPLVQIDSIDLQEVQDYLSMTGHIVNASILAMAESSYQALTDEQREVLEEAAAAASAEVTRCVNEAEERILAEWAEQSPPPITIIEQDEVDMDAFRANAEKVYTESPEYADMWGDYYTRILETR